MLCACSGEQFKFEEVPRSPESLATRDFSASGLSSRTTGEWDSKLEDDQVDEAESTLKEALSLNYEEARALLGRLEYQRGNFEAALQVFQGIDIKGLVPRMIRAIIERSRRRKPPPPRSRGDHTVHATSSVMSLHSVSLLLEAALLKARSLEELGRFREAAKECKMIFDTIESAFPSGMSEGIGEDCKMEEMFHRAIGLFPNLWIKAGCLDEAIVAYRRALTKPWNLDSQRLASIQKNLAAILLYGGVETNRSHELQVFVHNTPKDNTEEAILLLLILMQKAAFGEIKWDSEILDHLTYALTIAGQFELLANHFELVLPGIFDRAKRWYFLALCYTAAGQNVAALNLLKKVSGFSEAKHKPHVLAYLLGAKLSSQDPKYSSDGIMFSRRVLDLENHFNDHFMWQAHKFLGVCYGNAARTSLSDSERAILQKESLISLNYAVLKGKEDPEVILNLALENAVQRNLDVAFENAVAYTGTVTENSGEGWKLLTLILSAEMRFKDAETVLELAMDESGKLDLMELLRLKAALQIAQEQPKQAIETYRVLLALIQARREPQTKSFVNTQNIPREIATQRNMEAITWEDLAILYTKLGLWPDARICLHNARLIEFHSPTGWHATGMLFEAQSLHKEALVSFSVSLSIEPNYVPSIVSTAAVLLKVGGDSLPIARSFLMNALRLEPTNHDAWMKLGLISKIEGSLQQAAEFFQAAYELQLSAPVHPFT